MLVEDIEEELRCMEELQMPRWAYTSSEWNKHVMQLVHLRKLRQRLRED